jgi:hypothetical protein
LDPEINASVESGGDCAGAHKRDFEASRDSAPSCHYAIGGWRHAHRAPAATQAIAPQSNAPVAHARRQPLLAARRNGARLVEHLLSLPDRDPRNRVLRGEWLPKAKPPAATTARRPSWIALH